MKKFILTMIISLMMVFSANAQVATENSKLFDNIYAGVEAGVTTPFSFDAVFPLNTVAGLKVGKEITPVVGVEIEGQAFFNDNNVGRWTNTFVKGTNVGGNALINVSNLIWGYQGKPRFFEAKVNTGLSWLHYWTAGANDLLVKTGVDFCFNIDKNRAHSVIVSPVIYWNLTGNDAKLQFNRSLAQIGIMASYVYHFKTSNGTRYFKTYDVGAMMDEINRLNDELAKKPTEVIVEKIKEVPVTAAVESKEVAPVNVYVFFAQNSAELTADAKAILDTVNGKVDIVASASPEGNAKYNQALSERRANAVADYLKAKGVTVNSVKGVGVTGDTSGRVAIVTSK